MIVFIVRVAALVWRLAAVGEVLQRHTWGFVIDGFGMAVFWTLSYSDRLTGPKKQTSHGRHERIESEEAES